MSNADGARPAPRIRFGRSGLPPWLAVALLGAFAAPAHAQFAPAPGSPEAKRPDAPSPTPEPTAPFRGRFGLEAAKALLGVDDERAIARLGALDGESALQELTRLAEAPSSLSDRALLLLAQALARHANEPQGVRALYAIVARGGGDSGAPRTGKLVAMAREQAALALARGGDDEALGLLARMVKRGHQEGELAARALLAHPPSNLAPVLESPGLPNVTFAMLLEGLGDQRAFVPLREMVRRGSPAVQARAAIALTRLGHLETVELALHWLHKSQSREQLRAALEILLQTRHAEAKAAWAKLYAADPEAATELGFNYPLPALAEPVEKAFAKSEEGRLLTLLGHTGSERAVAFLVGRLGTSQGPTAAYALARSPAEAVSSALQEAASGKAAVRRLAVLALALRRHWLGTGAEPPGDVLEALTDSKRREDLWAGVWARSVSDSDYAEAQFDSPSLVVLAAVASVGAQPRDFGERAAKLLGKEKDSERAELLLLAALSSGARDDVPSHTLASLVDRGSPLSSLAVRALAERADPRFDTKVDALLGGTNVALRAAAALGLAKNPRPVATGRLVDALRFETEAEVRLAIVVGLSHRDSAPGRDAVLEVARDLDVDARVRAAARLGLAGQRLSLAAGGNEATWVELPHGDVPAWVTVSTAGAPVLPIPTAGQRVLPIVGIRSGEVRVRLASPSEADDDARSDAKQAEAPRAKR